ncbi:endonuclease/exonuclease/phosphatase family protein [Gilvimarinus agarilyticus]|uniref:endonuclease/exonuclease/phosphatase family protein n=1 Tax=Gilvimarinus sp. 2_MG-2023 TaxID=3062666 RepID=UPI001C08E714|nr:endonuclease/exonuclease/phosphatase family protein [Gilvimarinus sp. 2_MG-2023]MBU2887780.1 endonuclease/exonuclease/phosphatase family protein [Gilvimarinus agarilyticus]MDO6572419.1 endonuclease/exonuclease/phosphatase family protein [Gilvimarinus sp. 2_MG-2023]
MTLFICIATGILALATVLPLWRNPHWLVRGLDFPRLQLALIALALIPLQIFLIPWTQPTFWIVLIVTLGCLCRQLWWVLPYTRLWRAEVKHNPNAKPEHNLTIMTANVLTPNRQADTLLALVKKHQPDILVTLESDQWWQDQLDVLEADMPYCIKCPLDNLYGMHVYSRLELKEAETRYLVEDDIPSMHAQVILHSGDAVRAHFLHPAPPSPTENPESAERDAELVVVAKSVVESDQPVVVTGDLNDVAWSATTQLFRKLSGLLDPRIGRGMFNTFHAKYPFLRWPLDHLFHSRHFTVSSIERLPYFGSDHFPLLTRLAFTPNAKEKQEEPSTDRDEKSWAKSIAQEQEVGADDVPEPGE